MTKTKLEIGSIINIAGIDFIVLDKSEGNHYFFQDYVLCLSKDLLYKHMRFSKDSADYSKSDIRTKLKNELLPKLEAAVGKENILDTEVSLISSDGSTDCGKITDKVGLLTQDMYLKYKDIIERYDVDDWWWLATQYKGHSRIERCVGRVGALVYVNCDDGLGVRPFCKFNPKIFNLNLKDDDNDKNKA